MKKAMISFLLVFAVLVPFASGATAEEAVLPQTEASTEAQLATEAPSEEPALEEPATEEPTDPADPEEPVEPEKPEEPEVKEGWNMEDGKFFYVDQKKERLADGIHEIEGVDYLFVDGYVAKGVQEYLGALYLSGTVDGLPNPLLKSQRLAIGEKEYYSDENAQLTKGWKTLKDGMLFTDEEGVIQKGFFGEAPFVYYLDPITGYMVKGWTQIGDDWYYLRETSGTMATGWQWIDGSWVWLDSEDGKYAPKMREFSYGKFYTTRTGYIKGFYQLDGNTYYFRESSGSMATNWQYINGFWYYFGEDGVMRTGWQTINGLTFYLRQSGTRADGWQFIDGSWYYFRLSSGTMATGFQYIDGAWYFLRKSGTRATGWQYVNNSWYYMRESGTRVSGWQKIDDAWHYFYPDTGRNARGWQRIDGKNYYLIEKLGGVTGWQKIEGKTYYFMEKGLPYRAENQEVDINGIRYRFYSDGSSALALAHWDWGYSNGNFFRVNSAGKIVDTANVGKDFIVVSVPRQMMWLYRNGKPLSTHHIIGGRPGHPTKTGHYTITQKQMDRRLKGRTESGETWDVHVDYWMRYFEGWGIHDASWHPYSRFNDSNAWRWAGSHGCVNVRPSEMPAIYRNSYVGMPVIVY